MKGYSYTSTPPIGRTACTEPQCLYKGALYLYLTVELYVYSPCGPYGLYRACTSVQLFTFFQTPRAHNMPLDQKPHTRNFPLWNRRHQQSSSRTPTAERYPESVQSISRLHYPPFYAYFPSRLFLLRSFSHTLLQLHVHCILPAPRPLHPSIYLQLHVHCILPYTYSSTSIASFHIPTPQPHGNNNEPPVIHVTYRMFGSATVLHSASQRSFLKVNLHGRSPKGPRFAATVYSPKPLSMRFCFFIV